MCDSPKEEEEEEEKGNTHTNKYGALKLGTSSIEFYL